LTVLSETDRLVARSLAGGHPADAARVLERFPRDDQAPVLTSWDRRTAALVLEQMTPDAAAACAARLPSEDAREILSQLDLDSVAGILRRAPEESRSPLLESAGGRREALERLLSSPEGTAGSLMDPLVLALPEDLEVAEATERVRRSAAQAIDYLYVVDRGGRLTGVTSLRDLLPASPETPLPAMMRSSVMRLQVDDDRHAILAHPGWNEFHALPVVDAGGRYLGAVRYETLRRLESEGLAAPGAGAVSVAVSLGELYWLGLSGLVEGLGTAVLRGSGRGDDDGR